MKFVVTVLRNIFKNLKFVWNIAPILMLLEVWAVIRLLVIVILVLGIVIDSIWTSKLYSLLKF